MKCDNCQNYRPKYNVAWLENNLKYIPDDAEIYWEYSPNEQHNNIIGFELVIVLANEIWRIPIKNYYQGLPK